MDSRITPEMARNELERRNAARAELQRRAYIRQQSGSGDAQRMDKILGETRTPFDQLRDVAGGVIGGLGKGGQAIASYVTGGYAPTVDMNQIENMIASPNRSIGGEFLKGAGEYFPYGVAGGASLPGQLAGGAGYGAATAEPDQQNMLGYLPSGRTGSAITNALLNAITHGGFKFFNALRPSKFLRGSLSPEELQSNVKAAGETSTGLGDVIGSPFLKKQYENILSKTPFSGAPEKLQQAGQQVVQSGNDVLAHILGTNDPENVTDQIHSALNKQFEEHRNLKNTLYDDFNNEADKQFLHLPMKNLSEKAKEYRDAIESTNLLKFEPDIRRIFNKLEPYETPVNKIEGNKNPINQFGEKVIGEPINTHVYPTAKEVNLLKGRLNEYAKMYGASPDPEKRHMAKIFGDLASAAKTDLNDAIENSGNTALKEKYARAEKNYKENFSPFLDRQIYKFIGGKADPDTIVQAFLKASNLSDRSNSLSKLAKNLGPKANMLPYSYFSRALDNEGNLNPAKLSTLINKLGKKQFNVLVPDPVMRNKLKNYNKLYKMNTTGVNIMQNPATGQRALDILPAMMAHTASTLTGGALGGPLGAIAGLVAPGIVAKPIVNALTSPNIRRSIVNAMLENRDWNRNIVPALETGERGLSNQ